MKTRKILLIEPPMRTFAGIFSFYFPLGLTYLSGALKQAGYECRILDMDAADAKSGSFDFAHEYERYGKYVEALNNPEHPTWQHMRELIRAENPDFIGITAMTTKFGSVIQTARQCKRLLPNVPVIVGGAHASTMPDLTLEIPEVDVVVRGEAEETLPDLLNRLRSGDDLKSVLGISYRDGNVVCHNPDRPYVQNLDSIPLPDRGALMHPQNYSSEDMGVMLNSRGCPFRCSYCFHMWQRRVRYRSVENILSEIRAVRAAYGTTQFHFKDDSFTVNRKQVEALCAAIRREPYHINWSCTTRVDLIDDNLLRIMKEAGCNQVSVGIESGSKRILQETDKDITHEQILEAAKKLNQHRLFWSGYFMIGLPTETEADIRQTFAFLKRAKPYYAGLGVYNPFPRTKLFDQGVQMGLLNPKPDLQHFLTTNPKDLFFIDPRRRV
ncbi:MAG TPA: radical SAM protein, partial [Candidatus Ozemobacteraceae bacterium]|nr:radical SAM protein [Candidatus Ozemobacteraceae bacterium]